MYFILRWMPVVPPAQCGQPYFQNIAMWMEGTRFRGKEINKVWYMLIIR